MKRLTIIIICFGIITIGFAQNRDKNSYLKMMHTKILGSIIKSKSTLKVGNLNYLELKPDSLISYSDSSGNEPILASIYSYSVEKIIHIIKLFDSDSNQWSNDQKTEYFMDNNLPDLLYDPLVSQKFGYIYKYVYTGSIGDTLSVFHSWDKQNNLWSQKYKTRHHISSSGLDTLAETFHWNNNDSIWELNNIVKEKVRIGKPDTAYFTMYYPNLTDTIGSEVFIYKYNLKDQLEVLYQYSDGNLSKDSFIYNSENQLILDYWGYWGEWDENKIYDYLCEFKYDNKNRKKSVIYWDKQSGQINWEFDGSAIYYYSTELTNISPQHKIFSVFPNPSKDYISITDYEGPVTIVDLTGKILKKENISKNKILETNDLENGIYLIRLKGGITKKIIIER